MSIKGNRGIKRKPNTRGSICRGLLKELKDTHLTKRQMECLALSLYDGLSHRQIAKELGIARQSVDTTIKRAMKKLQKKGIEIEGKPVTKPIIFYVEPSILDSRRKIEDDGIVITKWPKGIL